jgi:hypothetical protein
MAATVVNSLTASYWAENKPSDYKGADLDKALKAYEGVASKKAQIVTSTIDPLKKAGVSDIDGYIATCKQAITVMEKAKVIQSDIGNALKAVVSAGNKASSDLTKLSKGKDVDESQYKSASTRASSIASMANDKLSDYQ